MGNFAYRKGNTDGSFDSLSHLLPTLTNSVPMISSIFQLLKGESKANTFSLESILPTLTQGLRELNPQALETLISQFSQGVPELKEEKTKE